MNYSDIDYNLIFGVISYLIGIISVDRLIHPNMLISIADMPAIRQENEHKAKLEAGAEYIQKILVFLVYKRKDTKHKHYRTTIR